MRRRNNCGLGAMLSQWAKEEKNYRLGKIWSDHYCGYVFGDQGYTNPQGVFLRSTIDQNGEAISLVEKRFVGNCPQPPDGKKYPLLSRGFQVPRALCNKCPHRKQGGFCQLLADTRKHFKSDIPGAIDAAVQQAKEMMK